MRQKSWQWGQSQGHASEANFTLTINPCDECRGPEAGDKSSQATVLLLRAEVNFVGENQLFVRNTGCPYLPPARFLDPLALRGFPQLTGLFQITVIRNTWSMRWRPGRVLGAIPPPGASPGFAEDFHDLRVDSGRRAATAPQDASRLCRAPITSPKPGSLIIARFPVESPQPFLLVAWALHATFPRVAGGCCNAEPGGCFQKPSYGSLASRRSRKMEPFASRAREMTGLLEDSFLQRIVATALKISRKALCKSVHQVVCGYPSSIKAEYRHPARVKSPIAGLLLARSGLGTKPIGLGIGLPSRVTQRSQLIHSAGARAIAALAAFAGA
ncbi:unnamed protein product [Notodromas monacha]|uniref:Uncharacterized protein n=1 Tax=Notodromas monacha TaxID=399045 RepID=A0A7R9BE96_9CRUS|nr:unnamed protein product [Notodromas monacha]CAG0912542.1 unnamed protein product [Notodromas monacha]